MKLLLNQLKKKNRKEKKKDNIERNKNWIKIIGFQDSATSYQRTNWTPIKELQFARCTCYLELLCWRWALIWCKRRSSTTWRTSQRGLGSSKRVTTRKMPTTTTRTTSNTTTRSTTNSRVTSSIPLDLTRWLETFAEFPSCNQLLWPNFFSFTDFVSFFRQSFSFLFSLFFFSYFFSLIFFTNRWIIFFHLEYLH